MEISANLDRAADKQCGVGKRQLRTKAQLRAERKRRETIYIPWNSLFQDLAPREAESYLEIMSLRENLAGMTMNDGFET